MREDYGLDARTIPGEEEARLSFLGATSGRDPHDPRTIVVLDIGGGSTEFIVGRGHDVQFHVSTQAGVVRQTERHLHHDPPTADELEALATDARATFAAAIPGELRTSVDAMIAVAGTATSMASIDQALEPYDPARVHGYHVTLDTCRAIGARLAAVPETARREVAGLHPDRAPSIVAGAIFITRGDGHVRAHGGRGLRARHPLRRRDRRRPRGRARLEKEEAARRRLPHTRARTNGQGYISQARVCPGEYLRPFARGSSHSRSSPPCGPAELRRGSTCAGRRRSGPAAR